MANGLECLFFADGLIGCVADPVMHPHTVFDEVFPVIKMQERIPLNLRVQRGRRVGWGVIVSGMQCRPARKPGPDAFQGVKHLFGITALQVATSASEYEQGVAGYQVVAEVETG